MEKFSTLEKYAILFLSIGIFVGGIIFLFTKMEKTKKLETKTETAILPDDQKIKQKEIFIHIAGAVAKPGVYKVVEDTRIVEIISLAQPLAYADINQLNLAGKVFDGQKIVVPEKNISAPLMRETTSSLININTASESELVKLPGVGPATAKKIIDYRTTKGNFASPEDIKNVPGIGPKKFEQFKDLITVY